MTPPGSNHSLGSTCVGESPDRPACWSAARLALVQSSARAGSGSDQLTANVRSGLLLASLQRVYQSNGVSSKQGASRTPGTDATPGAIGSAPLAIEALGDLGDLDPLPFVSHRDDSAGTKWISQQRNPAVPRFSDAPAQQATAAPEPQPPAVPAAPDRATADRRKLPRRDSDCAVLISRSNGDERPTPEKISWMLRAAKSRGHLLDVSMSGVALSLTEQFAPGARVVMRITNRGLSKHVDAAATVLRCREDAGEWCVVCRFDRNLTFEQIHLIGRNLFSSTIV